MKNLFLLSFLLVMLLFTIIACGGETRNTNTHYSSQTNILLITIDDFGYSDLGSFGSEINTPNLDALAQRGRRMAGLKTGLTDAESQNLILPIDREEQTFIQYLADSSYQSTFVGQWHGSTEPATVFSTVNRVEQPTEVSSQMIQALQKNNSTQPFFAWANYPSPTAIASPPTDYQNKYKGKYKEGYEVLRQTRFKGLQAAKIINEYVPFPLPMEEVTPWEELEKNAQYTAQKNMERHAASVEYLDTQIGHLLNYLEETEQIENTLIIFCAENGLAPNEQLEKGWVQAIAAHFNGYKGMATEAAISVPFIATGKHIKSTKKVGEAFFFLPDLRPTILASLGVKIPETTNKGRSLLPYWKGRRDMIHPPTEYIFLAEKGQTALRQGEWKLVTFGQKRDKKDYFLYNLISDPAERNDMSSAYPARKKRMIGEWQ